jgi:hypothetical protein
LEYLNSLIINELAQYNIVQDNTTLEGIDANTDDSLFGTSTRRTALKSIAGMAGTGIGALMLSGQTSADPAGYDVKLKNRHSGKVLEVEGWSYQNGANVQQWEDTGGANQKWHLNTERATQTGYVVIENLHSGKVLEVAGTGTHNGTNIQQWDWTGGDHQVWYRIPGASGHYVSAISNKVNKVMEVEGWGTDNGDNVQTWEMYNNPYRPNQQWDTIHI